MDILVDDAVNVGTGIDRWKVLAIDSETAHLTKLSAFERLDWRDVPVSRLTRAGNL